jgi:predicted DCC family thiol-disulfide oxidoreductase YuxK
MSILQSNKTSSINLAEGSAAIIYDGQCPFCTRYVQFIRLRDAIGEVRLIDARTDKTLVQKLEQSGINLNDGMVLIMDGEIFHGADCINKIAKLSKSTSGFGVANAWLFRSQKRAAIIYPVLRWARGVLLFILGRRPIHSNRNLFCE